MRLNRSKIILFIFLSSFVLFYKVYHSIKQKDAIKTPLKYSELKNITIIIREFESFDNDVNETAKSALLSCNSECTVLVISQHLIYPPLSLLKQVQQIVLNPTVFKSPPLLRDLLKWSQYVLFLPDGARISSQAQLKDHINILKSGNFEIVALGIGALPLNCYKYALNIKSWTLSISPTPNSKSCDGISGRAALLLRVQHLLDLTFPLSRPIALALNLQAAARKWKTHIARRVILGEGRQLFSSDHLQWKHEQSEEERIKKLYNDIGIKKVIEPNHHVKWYGCKRATSNCFPKIINETPSYLYAGKWTPPCCLEGLRVTARHVFQTLHACHIRYWIENRSLLGAVRNGDIIPWDHKVDVGMYAKDLDKCPHLKSSRWQTSEDSKGFVWQKAPEGNFFRVHYSSSNHLSVDIYPFHSKENMIIRGSWPYKHSQDIDFPEHFLKPFTSITFIGIKTPIPNNVRDFLELKYGPDVIENPQFSNPQLMALNISLAG